MSIFQRHPFLGDTETALEASEPKKAEEPKPDTTVPFDTFASVELRIGTVLGAEPVEGSEKLLRLKVDFGEGETRQVVSGIAKSFAPIDLLDRQFAFVANLPARPIMGLDSQAMILAADGEKLALVSPTTPVPPGSRLH